MDLEREQSRWAASQHLEDGCQFGFVLPFDLFFFSLLMLILCDLWSSDGVWERALDPSVRLGPRVPSQLFFINIPALVYRVPCGNFRFLAPTLGEPTAQREAD